MKREFGKTKNIILLYMNFISELNFNNKKGRLSILLILSILISCYIIFVSLQKSYVPILPNISFLHPDSKKESGEVLRKLKNRGGHEINLFYETDFSVVTAFKKVVPEESEEELNAIATEKNWLVLLLKYLINRPRPYQFCNEIKENMLISKTGNTPAYPSGHSFQAFYLAKKLSEKHPALQPKLYQTAEDCGNARIIAGIHYPSDHEFSRWLVSNL